MMESNPIKECSVCNEDFDMTRKCPRTLPCSHYLCTQCLQNLILRNNMKCPYCRRDFSANRAEEVMINRAVVEFLRYVTATQTQKKESKDSTSTLITMKKDAVKQMKMLKKICQDTKSKRHASFEKLDSLKRSSQLVNDKINELSSVLFSLRQENAKDIESLKSLEQSLFTSFKEVANREDALKEIMKELVATQKYEETGALMDELKEIESSIKYSVKAINNLVSTDLLHEGKQVIESRKATVDRISGQVNSLRTEYAASSPASTAQPCRTRVQLKKIEVTDLLQMKEIVVSLADTGRIFATQKLQGKQKYAKITVRGEKLLLHHLSEESVPLDAIVFEHQEVVAAADPSSCVAFLELIKKSEAVGTLFIDLSPDTRGARQFAHLCTGQFGPTYANTKLFSITSMGTQEERVCFGDYEYQNGTGGRGLCRGFGPMNEYKRKHEAGIVCGVGWRQGNSSVSAQFAIRTRDKPERSCDMVFGNVTEGLGSLISAIQTDGYEIMISDCGIVLSKKNPSSRRQQ